MAIIFPPNSLGPLGPAVAHKPALNKATTAASERGAMNYVPVNFATKTYVPVALGTPSLAEPLFEAAPFQKAERVVAVPQKAGPYRLGLKRLFDLAAVVVALPVVLPVVAVAACLVARDGGRPFYSQMRVGKDGKPFRMWKLRSMVRDADQRMESYLAAHPAARAEWDLSQKLQSDPRITPFGAFLRKSSLDELPQLWNVLRGEMSLVGPRPMMLCQRAMYDGTAYYRLRPGLTGLWQTAGRNRTSFQARSLYDGAYEADVTFANDLRILRRTVSVVVKGTGC
ncbi:sugar transferase [Xinfangfangia sp. CPCC 101601]|uniref:Sugar transferase n=1 Tax=Pseudogemmobacter lacusdianii TaxID=3069608 RepID=A0ABU0VWU6_9RHOB|nr:sugar transferase [Xinfangfangia sp. CPCC 101601]MDQ2066234.1 sugar transferase [Xinfangfangia sp. CPCC 101601]